LDGENDEDSVMEGDSVSVYVRVGIRVLDFCFEGDAVGSFEAVTVDDGDAVMVCAVRVPSAESVMV
jgi:hypothetical protein